MTLSIPPIGLGTGGEHYLAGDECVDVVSAALEMGYRHVDTAQSYGNEAAVGEALEVADVPRSDVLVATKVEKHDLAHDDVLETARESREKLGVDTIDLLYVHFPTTTYEPESTLPAMDELVDAGVVEHVGVSNFSPDEMAEAADVLDNPVAVNQVEMHPFCQQRELVDYAQSEGVPIVAYCPLARGDVFDQPEISTVADKHAVTEAQVALAWLVGIDGVGAVPKTTSSDHLAENLAAADLELDAEDVRRIESIDETTKFVDIG